MPPAGAPDGRPSPENRVMDPDLKSALIRLATFATTLVVVVVACHIRRLPLRSTLALRLPDPWYAAGWLAAFLALAGVSELVSRRLGLEEITPRSFTPLVTALRFAGMVIMAPIAEEVVFRGLLFTRLRATRLGDVGAVVLTAVLFAALHFQYNAAGMTFVLIDGLFYGLVRARTESTPLTMLMHSGGNLFAFLQRLA
jgi:membrane protease YdiL (CAAX protease family)